METRTLMKKILFIIILFSGIAKAQFAINTALADESVSYLVIGYIEFVSIEQRDDIAKTISDIGGIKPNINIYLINSDFAEVPYYDIRFSLYITSKKTVDDLVTIFEAFRKDEKVRMIVCELYYGSKTIDNIIDKGTLAVKEQSSTFYKK
jgi:hypothetical protein